MNFGIHSLPRREAMGLWLNEMGLTGKGAEIGVAGGNFSAMVLSQWKGEKLYMVDPWRKRPSGEYLEITNELADFDSWYQSCIKLSEKDSRAVPVRMTSLEASTTIEDESLDWVYIDAAHDHFHVMQDMDVWWPKVKRGGLFGGHDFYNNKENGNFCEVELSVKRWTSEHNRTFCVCPCTSWFILKQ